MSIGSPSKEMRKLGRWSGEGMAIGLDKSIKDVEKSSETMAEKAVPNLDMSYATPSRMHTSMRSAVKGVVDVDSRDRNILNALKSLENRMNGLKIVMDEREVGKIVEPHVSVEQMRGRREYNRRRGRL